MGQRYYKLTQEFSDGSNTTLHFKASTDKGTYNVICGLSNGETINAGKIEINKYSAQQTYNMEVQLSNGETIYSKIMDSFGMYPPLITETNYQRDNYMGSFTGSVMVTNPNDVPVRCLVWYKSMNSEDIRENGSFTLEPGQSHCVIYSDIYSTGILTRLHFTAYNYGIYENELFTDCELGNYAGTYDFYGVEAESSTTTTTTTTTVDELSTQPTPIESQGKFTLWRIQDVK